MRGYQGQGGAAGRSKQEWLEHMCLSVCAHVLCCCLCAHAQGPDWANLDLQLADELHAISKQDREAGQGGVGGEGFGQGCELDRFVVEAPSAYLDTRFGALEESALVGEGGAKGQEDGEELAYSQADRSGLSVTFSRARARSLAREAPVLSYYQCGVAVAHSCACGALARVCARTHTHTRMCTQNRDHAALRYKRISYCARRGLGNPAGRCAISGASAFVRTFPHLCLHTCIRRQLSSHPQACVHVVHAHMRTCAHAHMRARASARGDTLQIQAVRSGRSNLAHTNAFEHTNAFDSSPSRHKQGSTMNGGWRNPAKHSARTGVSVLAAGKWWDETYSNGTEARVRGSPVRVMYEYMYAVYMYVIGICMCIQICVCVHRKCV